ncbi:hypothetical protein D3C86_2051190 [compost metagenome]
MARCDSAMITAPLTPCGLKWWKTALTIVAPQATAAPRITRSIASGAASRSAGQLWNSAMICWPR